MKTKTTFPAIAAFALLSLAACQTEEEQVSSNFPADGVIRVTTHVENPVTRAGMTTGNINRFNIKIDNAANATYSYYGFYYKQNDVWSSYTDGNMGTPLTMLWQNSTQPVTVTALSQQGTHSTEAEFTTGLRYDVSSDQSSESLLQFSDILYMKPTVIDPATDLTDGKLPITFNHIMSKVNFTVTLGTELNVTPGTGTNPIEAPMVNGTIIKFIWNASTNSAFDLTNYSAESITPFAAAYAADNGTVRAVANYEVILVPQTVAAGNFSISFKIGDKDYIWTSPNEITFDQGNIYTLALTAGKDVVTLKNDISTSEWGDGTGGKLETE